MGVDRRTSAMSTCRPFKKRGAARLRLKMLPRQGPPILPPSGHRQLSPPYGRSRSPSTLLEPDYRTP